jgi:hypothetical protein
MPKKDKEEIIETETKDVAVKKAVWGTTEDFVIHADNSADAQEEVSKLKNENDKKNR